MQHVWGVNEQISIIWYQTNLACSSVVDHILSMMERYSAKEISSEDAGAIPAMLKILVIEVSREASPVRKTGY